MDLRQLKQFVAVAETRSFSRAAERLCMAQPPLSVAIRKLEEEIGFPLFERGSRGVQLTPAGDAALEAARKCLRDAEEVLSAARAAAGGEAGRLRIGFIGSVTFGLMPRLIQAFRAHYPNVKLELVEATNQELLSAVEGETLDIGFLRMPTAQPPGVKVQLIERDVFVAALPAQHALARRKSLSMKDLANQPFIGYTPSRVGGLHAAVTQLLMHAGVSPSVTQEAVQVQTVMGLVASGLGMALVPSVNAAAASDLVAIRPIRDLPRSPSIGIGLAYRASGESVVAKRFREVVGEVLGQ
ncbi:LysR family transcriptional regulator [Piscinibacter sp.]|uniref:LysR family transcriptional regulator n=1 Tax=Piscinibacter sp. TaxID=1903157 RepID=UPI002BDEF784|nr:LysR family transcriptional regulator [Albitalea sp.]HUG21094.1 LysR family transcriptional regulator [Albitalea sp.]